MKGKILVFLLVLSFMLVGATSSAFAAPVDKYLGGLGPATYPDYYTDAEKSPTNPDDDLLCWAAAASNVLAWTEWDGGLSNEDLIFANFISNWTNAGSQQKWGWEWWFTGTVTDSKYWSDSDSIFSGGSAHYTKAEYDANVWAWDYDTPNIDLDDAEDKVKEFIDADYCSTLSLARYIGPDEFGGHAITLWGYNWDDETEIINGVWVSDSDDNKNSSSPPNILEYYALTHNIWGYNQWYLDGYGEHDWWINGISGLFSYEGNGQEPPPSVPEPATLLLLGSGLVCLFGIGRRKLKRG